jgi:hypothetical protein
MLGILLMKVGIPADGVKDAGARLLTTVRAAKPACDGASLQLAPPPGLPVFKTNRRKILLPVPHSA